jgi:hypothetical protein
MGQCSKLPASAAGWACRMLLAKQGWNSARPARPISTVQVFLLHALLVIDAANTTSSDGVAVDPGNETVQLQHAVDIVRRGIRASLETLRRSGQGIRLSVWFPVPGRSEAGLAHKLPVPRHHRLPSFPASAPSSGTKSHHHSDPSRTVTDQVFGHDPNLYEIPPSYLATSTISRLSRLGLRVSDRKTVSKAVSTGRRTPHVRFR